jgi:hypothetical protein
MRNPIGGRWPTSGYQSGLDERIGNLSSFRVSIGKVKRVFCFSIVLDNQAKGISRIPYIEPT